MKPIALIAVLAFAVFVTACGEEQPPGADPFGSTVWQLVSGTADGTALVLVDGRLVTLVVENGAVGGVSACNSYGGDITIENGVVTIGPTFMTEMYCVEDGVMDLEAAYHVALNRINKVALDGDALVLKGNGVELRFVAQLEVPDAALVGTNWTLESIVDGGTASTPAAAAAAATIVFAADGTVSGSTGCNSFFGDYSTTAGFGALGMTRMACEEPIMVQETLVAEILGPNATLTIEGSRLTIADLEGRALVFRAGA